MADYFVIFPRTILVAFTIQILKSSSWYTLTYVTNTKRLLFYINYHWVDLKREKLNKNSQKVKSVNDTENTF